MHRNEHTFISDQEMTQTQMGTLQTRVKNINFASQKEDRFLAYGGFFVLFCVFTMWSQCVYLHNYKCSFAGAEQKEEKESSVRRGVRVGAGQADLAQVPSTMSAV